MLKRDIHIESIYTELPFEERLAAAKQDGFDFVEMWGWEDKDLPQLKKLLDENELKLAAMSGDGPYSMCDPADKEKYLNYIQRSITAAKEVGCPVLVIHSDALEEWPQFAKPMAAEYSYETRICAMLDVLKTIAPWAKEAGITFVLEALNVEKDHCGNFLTTTKTAVDLVAAVGSPNVKVLYDAYHMYLNEGKICETTEKYLPYIGHLHIADAPGRHEPGTGVINFPYFVEHLEKIGYEGSVGFEFYPKTDTSAAVKAVNACFDNVRGEVKAARR
ncbi:TIM barrel protein [Domibacillus enclensis]|uniref:AP endonuclease n=1 Tax=Domibacillus enclensis TaxID=1017273 RepID=A0A1N6N8P3_9BACI|nr:TIM barrel protein [Domibacillus enclensis]OXS79957.1 AP endonuclease [Domibacillus enclensis]SIP88439.1 hydroxypyruvate isomerase [Domibacillus enclensis]